MLRIIPKKLFSSIKIPIESIKKLREDTSAPLGQCKKALQQNNGDHQTAMLWLKKRGLLSAKKRAEKETREGVIGSMVSSCRSKVVMVEVNCQTDFVAKNQLFLNFVNNMMARAIEAEYLLDYKNPEEKQESEGIQAFLEDSAATDLFPDDTEINNMLQEYKIVMSRLQQNIRVRRIITLHSEKQKYGIYVHRQYQDYVGVQASVVEFETNPQLDLQNEQQFQTFTEFADNIATQLLGSPPQYLTEDQIPEEVLSQQREKVIEQMSDTLKKAPQQSHKKIIEGKLHSTFYVNNVLPKMNFLLSNDGIAVEQYWASIEKSLGKQVKVKEKWIWECK